MTSWLSRRFDEATPCTRCLGDNRPPSGCPAGGGAPWSPASLLIPPSLHVEALLLGDDGLTILAVSEATDVRCPLCGERADRVHSRYARTLADLPWARLRRPPPGPGPAVLLRQPRPAPARSSPSGWPASPRPSPTGPTASASGLTAIALALGGEAGARLAAKLGMPVSPDTLLRLIRRRARGRAAHADGARRRRLGDPQGADLRHDPGRPRTPSPGRSAAGSLEWQPRRLAEGASRRGGHRPRSRRRLRRGGAGRRARRHPGRRPLAPGRQPGRRPGGLLPRQGIVPEGRRGRAGRAGDRQRKETDGAAPPPADAVYQGKRRHPQPERWRERAGGGRRGRGGAPPGEVRAGPGAPRQRGDPSRRSRARSGSPG